MRTIYDICFIVLLVVWGCFVNWRINHARIRGHLLSIIFLMIFWIVLRRIKYDYVTDPGITRQIWYLYYLPMLLMPTLYLYIAESLGKSEKYRLSFKLQLFSVVSCLLVILVLTNDFHQKVFSFPADALVWSDREYRYEAGYFVIVAWEAFSALLGFFIMLRRVRALKRRLFLVLQLLSMGVLALYCALYVMHLIPHIYPLYDLAFMFCACVTVMLESCIQSGLIQSNMHYATLFRLSTIDGQIADKQFQTRLLSNQAVALSEDEIRRVTQSPVITQEHIRLSSAPLKNGYILWKEDISEISEMIEELADKSEYLATRRDVLEKEVSTKMRERKLAEKNRLYNALMDEMRDVIADYDALLEQIGQSDEPREVRRLVERLAVICTYIKRRSNLIFLAEEDGFIEAEELGHAMREWMSSLKMGGIASGCSFDMTGQIALSDMLFLYDIFQKILLYSLDTLKNLFVNCCEEKEKPCLLVTLTCKADFSSFPFHNVVVLDEDGDEKILEITLP